MSTQSSFLLLRVFLPDGRVVVVVVVVVVAVVIVVVFVCALQSFFLFVPSSCETYIDLCVFT